MNIRKKVGVALAAAVLCASTLVGCGAAGGSATGSAAQASGNKIEVVCATFPAYDWVREVVGDEADRFEITYLTGNGVDLHSYQPTVQDVASITDADLFVYVGGESDGWAEDAVEAAKSSKLHVVNMMEVVGDDAKEEEVVEGMQAAAHDHEHAEAEEHDHEHAEGEAPEYDEHVWLSLKNAQELTGAIAGELGAIDAEHASTYTTNAQAYAKQLKELDSKYQQAVKDAKKNTVVFADRFPFRYLVDDYGLKYYAAFVGCSAETEASFETVAFLAQKVDELGLSSVLVIENSDQQIAKTVVENTKDKNQKIQVMDSLQSASNDDIAAGKTYLTTMENNLAVLASALS